MDERWPVLVCLIRSLLTVYYGLIVLITIVIIVTVLNIFIIDEDLINIRRNKRTLLTIAEQLQPKND